MVDPVCGTIISPEDAVAETEYGGETYYFCSDECLAEFERDPEQYAVPVAQHSFY